MCAKTGPKVDALTELLLRQIHPSWLDPGGVTSQAFIPSKKDDGCLSVNCGSILDAAASLSLHTAPPPKGLGLKSAGTWGVTLREIDAVKLEAWRDPVAADPTTNTPANPAHTVIDFASLSAGQRKAIGRVLAAHANDRKKLA